MRTGQFVAILVAAALAAPPVVVAHAERKVSFPAGTAVVPAYRTDGSYKIVCKPDTPDRLAAYPFQDELRELLRFIECRAVGFEHLQAAVDAVAEPGTRILLQPGHYLEEPSVALREAPSPECASIAKKAPLTYEEQVKCPHAQNLVAIFGDDPEDPDLACTAERLCRLQVEGTGRSPGDVIVDGRFQVLNVVRADRADGVYFRNFLVQRSEFNALYVMELDGFVIDTVVARWNDEYGFLTFAVDHGLYVNCEAYGNGDSGIYPGSAADLHGIRPSVEITRCNSHHNTLGYSGTAGNSVWAHDNEFHHNAAGVSMDSFFPDHPGLPQDAARFEANRIYANQVNYYDNYLGNDPPCRKPFAQRGYEEGIVCPTVPVPVGTGILVAGGNANNFTGNWIYDNWRYGTMQFSVPAQFRNESDPSKTFDTSHLNRYVENAMGLPPNGTALPNGLDHWWDEGGSGNCWADNRYGPRGARSDPPPQLLPPCGPDPGPQRPPNGAKLATLAPCAQYDRETNHHPTGCDWMTTPPRP